MSKRRIVIVGNSGSGKTTLARLLHTKHSVAILDLDTIAWQPDRVGVRRDLDESFLLLDEFMREHAEWVIEGCYSTLVERASKECTELLFLDPGIEKCLENNRRRPWEPHKYASEADQDLHFTFLQDWVRQYYERSDEYSYREHERIFMAFTGAKQKIQ